VCARVEEVSEGQRGGREEDERAGVDAKDVSASFVVGKAELDTAVDTTGTKEGGVEGVGSEGGRKRVSSW
jgi:hypothetical protein